MSISISNYATDGDEMSRTIARFGWIPDLPDHRDHLYSASLTTVTSLPAKVDLRPHCPPIYNQGRIGSCTANAIAGAIEFDRMKKGQSPDFIPSRLFIYYNERDMEGDPGVDGGAQLRDGIKSVATLGACPESDWPYDDTPAEYDGGPFPVGSRPATKPPQQAYNDAADYRAISYQRVSQSLTQTRGCLAEGYPFVFGFTVYDSFFGADGKQLVITPLPNDSAKVIGGHAVVAVGYDDQRQLFIVRNSWGTDEGEDGYYYMPYTYVSAQNLASDLWTIRTISD